MKKYEKKFGDLSTLENANQDGINTFMQYARDYSDILFMHGIDAVEIKDPGTEEKG